MMDDFASVQRHVQSALVSTTRSTSAVADEDLPFHRSLSASLSARLDRQNARLLGLASTVLGAAASTSDSVRAAPLLKELDNIDGNWRAVIDVVDSLLERADTALDEFTGAVRRLTPDAEAKATTAAAASRTSRMSELARRLKNQDMAKPQLQFENVPTNREQAPFKPLLLSKPHALDPLSSEPVSLEGLEQQHYPHPYQHEIEQYRFPASVYTQADPLPYPPFDKTSATFVDTEEGVHDMLQELRQAKEIAIDLEHHDQRSYIGIVSLMQISTRSQDWIVDTLQPWRRRLECLNEVLADPSIVKVLHGAYMDIVWLQRDLGLYIVGLFDTHYAARALGYPGGSLAYLLKKFVNFDANKQYQTADWRIRPLPQELLDYARSDTHYLLYIFDCMRNELIQRSDFSLPDHEGDKILAVLERSSETALQRYEHPTYDYNLGQGPTGWYKLLSRTSTVFNKEQFSVFRAVHQWRDEVARELDESVHYIMPNHHIFHVAREMPVNRATLLNATQPGTSTIRLRAEELVNVIADAKKSGKDGPEMTDILNRIDPYRSTTSHTNHSHTAAGYVPQPTMPMQGIAASTSPLRSTTSNFWGTTLRNYSAGEGKHRALHGTPDVSLSVPIPLFDGSVSTSPTSPAFPIGTVHDTRAEDNVMASDGHERTDDDRTISVLGEMGKKRRRDESFARSQFGVDGMAAQSDEVSINDEESILAQEKAASRKAKKEARKAAKVAATGGDDLTGTVEAPFDYASAPSILHPPRDEGRNVAERKKQVNPYAKLLDAPKSAPRNPAAKERAGRSLTFNK